jgi:ribonuclease J
MIPFAVNCNKVIYSEITDNLHVSGHGSQQDMLLLMALTKAKYVLPIGGMYRHIVQYANLAKSMGYSPDRILLPEHNQSILVSPDKISIGPKSGSASCRLSA